MVSCALAVCTCWSGQAADLQVNVQIVSGISSDVTFARRKYLEINKRTMRILDM